MRHFREAGARYRRTEDRSPVRSSESRRVYEGRGSFRNVPCRKACGRALAQDLGQHLARDFGAEDCAAGIPGRPRLRMQSSSLQFLSSPTSPPADRIPDNPCSTPAPLVQAPGSAASELIRTSNHAPASKFPMERLYAVPFDAFRYAKPLTRGDHGGRLPGTLPHGHTRTGMNCRWTRPRSAECVTGFCPLQLRAGRRWQRSFSGFSQAPVTSFRTTGPWHAEPITQRGSFDFSTERPASKVVKQAVVAQGRSQKFVIKRMFLNRGVGRAACPVAKSPTRIWSSRARLRARSTHGDRPREARLHHQPQRPRGALRDADSLRIAVMIRRTPFLPTPNRSAWRGSERTNHRPGAVPS
jgi:hypothetical protein